MTGEPAHTAPKERMVPDLMFSPKLMPKLLITEKKRSDCYATFSAIFSLLHSNTNEEHYKMHLCEQSSHYVIVKALPHVCMEMQHEGVGAKYSTRRSRVLYIFALRYPLSAVFFVHTSIGTALSVLLYFLVILFGVIFFVSTFGDRTISKLSYNLFVVVE